MKREIEGYQSFRTMEPGLREADMVSLVAFKGFGEVRIVNPISKLRKWRPYKARICTELTYGPGGI